MKNNGPKILLFDLETAPMLGYIWQLFDQNVALNQLHTDWHILSYAAKWLGDKKILYKDQRDVKNIGDDSVILKEMWDLLNEADIVVTQNGKKFDVKKINARFVMNKFPPPSSFKQIDTLVLAKKHFGFTSNKLEYMSSKLCTKYKKLSHKKFPGFELWSECLKNNPKAWKEMELYNKHDVLALEELYLKLVPWESSINFTIYTDNQEHVCTCGSKMLMKNGHTYKSTGKFQRYKCAKCGKEVIGKQNLLLKPKK